MVAPTQQNFFGANTWEEWLRRMRQGMTAPTTTQQQPSQTAYTGQPGGDPFRVQGFSFGAPQQMALQAGDLAGATDTAHPPAPPPPPPPAHPTMSPPVPQPTAVGNPPAPGQGGRLNGWNGTTEWMEPLIQRSDQMRGNKPVPIKLFGSPAELAGGTGAWSGGDHWVNVLYSLGITLDESKDQTTFLYNGQPTEKSWSHFLRLANDLQRANPTADPRRIALAVQSQIQRDANGRQTAFFGESIPQLQQVGRTVAGGGPDPAGNPAGPGDPGGPAGPGNPAGPAGPINPASLRGARLMEDPQAAYQTAVRAMGLDPSAPSVYGQWLRNTLTPLLQQRMQLQGLGDPNYNAADSAEAVAQQFGQAMQRPGAFGAQQQFAAGLLADPNAQHALNTLQDQGAAQKVLGQLLNMRYVGANPIVAQAYGDEFQRAMGGYEYQSLQDLGVRTTNPVMQWLSQSPWAYILGGR